MVSFFFQVNGRKTKDFDCCLTIPLITEAGNKLSMIVCRNPIANDNNNTELTQPRIKTKGHKLLDPGYTDVKSKSNGHNSLDIGNPDVTAVQSCEAHTPKSV